MNWDKNIYIERFTQNNICPNVKIYYFEQKYSILEMLLCAVMDMPQDAIDLMAKILVYSPRKRLTAIGCLRQAYCDNLSKNEQYKHLFDWRMNIQKKIT